MDYTYASVEQADQDMSHWHAPANGSISHGPGGVHIRSAIIQYPVPDKADDDTDKLVGADETRWEDPRDTMCGETDT